MKAKLMKERTYERDKKYDNEKMKSSGREEERKELRK